MKVLIVADMQNDFVTGVLGTPEARAIVPNIVNKIEQYLENEEYVYLTKDTHFMSYLNTQEGKFLPVSHCIYQSFGWKLIPEIDAFANANFNCESICKIGFGHSWHLENMYKFDEIEIIGVCTDICVISNALFLKSLCPEMRITVDASCCAGTTPEMHEAALKIMKSCQIYITGE